MRDLNPCPMKTYWMCENEHQVFLKLPYHINYYYYYYRKKRFRWRNVKRLQGHLTNAKDSDKTRVRRKVRTEYLSDAIVGRAVG